MNSKSILAAVALVAAIAVTAPALAQELTGSAANRARLYGNSPRQPDSYAQSYRASGLGAYAAVPGAASASGRDAAATGGGSIGYNSHNESDY